MSDYADYIDQELIDEAEHHFEAGDFYLAEIKFRRARRKLVRYNGDRMLPMMLAQSLSEKIKVCKFFREMMTTRIIIPWPI